MARSSESEDFSSVPLVEALFGGTLVRCLAGSSQRPSERAALVFEFLVFEFFKSSKAHPSPDRPPA